MPDRKLRDYSSVKVSGPDFKAQGYKEYFGGGSAQWEKRGAFQLYFLEKMGLLPASSFLDIGCGPLRGGSHIIQYLDPQMYQGVDYNPDFIAVARNVVEQDPRLKMKAPRLLVLQNFAFAQLTDRSDFALAFSVLNHCSPAVRNLFFRALPDALRPSGKVFITHAYWFDYSAISAGPLAVTKTIATAHDISPDLNLGDWGWDKNETIFPIVEITSKG